MHRHGYKGRKFGREKDQRTALVKGLADSLIIYESIETTLPKAKDVVPYVEKLITKAKKGDLHSRRQVIAKLQTLTSAHKLVDEIAPKISTRTSGHLRIEKTTFRKGDNAQLARISFVDDLKSATKKTDQTSTDKTKPVAKEVEGKHDKSSQKSPASASKMTARKTVKTVAKRSGVRGNR